MTYRRSLSQRLKLLLILLLLSAPSYLLAGLCYVNHAATGDDDGSTWENAYVDLQDALGDLDCDEVWVAAGTYFPTDDGDHTVSFELRDELAVYGGFDGTETDRSERDWVNFQTTLSGDIGVQNSCHVVRLENSGPGFHLDGFTITQGSADGCPQHTGGGMYILNASGTFENLVITGNWANTGGGVHLESSDPTFTNILFNSNSSGNIAGAFNITGQSSPTIQSSLFVSNSSHGGGAVVVSNSMPVFRNVTFSLNNGWFEGGAISASGGLTTLENVTFSGNSSDDGGAIRGTNLAGIDFLMRNVLFSHNSGGNCVNVAVQAGSKNNLVDTAESPCGLVHGEDGNLVGVDPMLGLLDNNGGFTPTHALMPGSPAIGAGSNEHCPETDQRGIARPQGSACDIGAYEFVDVFFQDRFEVASLQAGDTFSDCDDCPTMVVIPTGTFIQGASEGEPESQNTERPQREVNVPAFAMGQTAVTFAEWDACVADGGCTHVPNDSGWGRGNRPVIDVSWYDAQEYVTWLSNKTGHDYRLPSESEWEYAARAGTTGRFNTGDCITTDQANFHGNFPAQGCPSGILRNQTLPVASFVPNGFGLYDTHGNAREWVQDCWNPDYVGAPTNGSAWMSGDCNYAVIRGGNWGDNGFILRSALRLEGLRSSPGSGNGFRVARALEL
jgi:predicted outer membrane repeat protein